MTLRTLRTTRKARHGFTLLEILLVVAIIIILVSLVGMYVFPYLSSSKADIAKAKARKLDLPVQAYYMRHRNWPSDLSVLAQPDPDNSNMPWVEEGDLLDPWDQPYQYTWPGVNNKNAKPDIFTTNPDSGQQIGNWGR